MGERLGERNCVGVIRLFSDYIRGPGGEVFASPPQFYSVSMLPWLIGDKLGLLGLSDGEVFVSALPALRNGCLLLLLLWLLLQA